MRTRNFIPPAATGLSAACGEDDRGMMGLCRTEEMMVLGDDGRPQ
jgi:hypothetical protein